MDLEAGNHDGQKDSVNVVNAVVSLLAPSNSSNSRAMIKSYH